MANNQNLSNFLLKNIDNEIPITFDLITPSKETTETTTHAQNIPSMIR